jgi:hypothetical protein
MFNYISALRITADGVLYREPSGEAFFPVFCGYRFSAEDRFGTYS